MLRHHRPRNRQDAELLKVTNLQVGLLINFKHPKLEFKRIVR